MKSFKSYLCEGNPKPFSVDAFMKVRPSSKSTWGAAFKHGYDNPDVSASKAGIRAGGKDSTARNAFVAGQRSAKKDKK